MKPSEARKRLGKRRAWLVARVEELASRPSYFLTEEIEALDYVLSILEAIGGPRNGGAPAEQPELVQRARDELSDKRKRCTCGRCPVHDGATSGKMPQ